MTFSPTSFYKFADEAEWRKVAEQIGVLSVVMDDNNKEADAWACYTPDWAIDVVGIIYDPGTYDADGNELTPPVAHDGYHVNAKFKEGQVPAAVSSYATTPATPRRVFLGD